MGPRYLQTFAIPSPAYQSRFILTLVTEMAIAYTDKELDLFVDQSDHLRTNIPGIFANLDFAECE